MKIYDMDTCITEWMNGELLTGKLWKYYNNWLTMDNVIVSTGIKLLFKKQW